jgi:N-methylhydantoinase B
VQRTWRILGHEAHAAVCCERQVTPPFGLAGGQAGGTTRVTLALPDGTQRDLNSKGGFFAPAGSQLMLRSPGSGGFGPPGARDKIRLADDVVDGYVTEEAAAAIYQGSSLPS